MAQRTPLSSWGNSRRWRRRTWSLVPSVGDHLNHMEVVKDQERADEFLGDSLDGGRAQFQTNGPDLLWAHTAPTQVIGKFPEGLAVPPPYREKNARGPALRMLGLPQDREIVLPRARLMDNYHPHCPPIRPFMGLGHMVQEDPPNPQGIFASHPGDFGRRHTTLGQLQDQRFHERSEAAVRPGQTTQARSLPPVDRFICKQPFAA